MDVRIDDLPESLQEMVQVIGLRATIKLMEHFGGVRIWVPSEIPPDHELRRHLGDAADKLASYYALESVAVPRGVTALRRIRDQQIRARYAAGQTAPALAREYGMTERRIWYIIAEAGETEPRRQGELF